MYKIDNFTYTEWLNYGKINYRNENWEIKKYADKLKDVVCLLIGCTREQLEDRTFKETELGEEWWYYNINYMGYIIPYNEAKVSGEKYDFDDLVKPTPRMLLQSIGTNLFREQLNPDIWINALFSDYKQLPKTKRFELDTGSYCGNCISCKKRVFTNNKRFVKCDECIDSEEDVYPNWIITDVRFPNEVKAIKDRGGIVIRVDRYTGNILIDNDTHAITDWQHPSETVLDTYEDWDYVIYNDGTIEDLIEKVRKLDIL